ncbi:hypothetical protein T06_13808 [Trichinella sp. T6]|nr:hypothetical protein T06_13808 [Trichinella sp. T6]
MCHNGCHIVHKRHQKLADDGNTSSRHSKLSYIASGQPISLSCRQTVPEVVSGKQRSSQAIGLCQFGLDYHNVARHHGAVVIQVDKNLAPGVASGYAPGQIKICIFPQAMPQAIYSTIIGLRGATPQAMPQAIFKI